MQSLSHAEISKLSGEGASTNAPAEKAEHAAVKRRWKPWAFLLLSLATFLLSLLVSVVFREVRSEIAGIIVRTIGGLGFAFSALIPLWGAGRGILNLRRETSPRFAFDNIALVFGYVVVAVPLMFMGFLLAMMSTFNFSRGRQLRRHGRVLLPKVVAGGGWTGSINRLVDGTNAPAGLADRWRENGRTEHASVASFARLTLDLMALGAPPELVRAANEDALDEIRHTQACFALASAIDGKAESPGAFPEAQRAHTLSRWRRLALVELAVLSLIDGALHEGVSARIVAKLGRRCEQPVIRRVLLEIAADEGRHAAHGWDVVDWCLSQGGRPVAHALTGALAGLPKKMATDLPEAAKSGGWERWGIHGQALEAEEYDAACRQLHQRVAQRVREYLPETLGNRVCAKE